MRAYGFNGSNKRDPSRGVKITAFYWHHSEYEWLKIREAKAFLLSLQKAIEKAEKI